MALVLAGRFSDRTLQLSADAKKSLLNPKKKSNLKQQTARPSKIAQRFLKVAAYPKRSTLLAKKRLSEIQKKLEAKQHQTPVKVPIQKTQKELEKEEFETVIALFPNRIKPKGIKQRSGHVIGRGLSGNVYEFNNFVYKLVAHSDTRLTADQFMAMFEPGNIYIDLLQKNLIVETKTLGRNTRYLNIPYAPQQTILKTPKKTSLYSLLKEHKTMFKTPELRKLVLQLMANVYDVVRQHKYLPYCDFKSENIVTSNPLQSYQCIDLLESLQLNVEEYAYCTYIPLLKFHEDGKVKKFWFEPLPKPFLSIYSMACTLLQLLGQDKNYIPNQKKKFVPKKMFLPTAENIADYSLTNAEQMLLNFAFSVHNDRSFYNDSNVSAWFESYKKELIV